MSFCFLKIDSRKLLLSLEYKRIQDMLRICSHIQIYIQPEKANSHHRTTEFQKRKDELKKKKSKKKNK